MIRVYKFNFFIRVTRFSAKHILYKTNIKLKSDRYKEIYNYWADIA